LHINSQNRSYGHFYDFAIQLQPAINAVKKIKLLALALPLSNYTVNTGFDSLDTSLAMLHEEDNSINLFIPLCIFIKIAEFPTMCRSSNNINGTFPIYINTVSGEINCFYSNLYFENISFNTISFTNMLHIQLIDPDTSSLFDINDNEISLLLELEY
jgi:hypothetical protein